MKVTRSYRMSARADAVETTRERILAVAYDHFSTAWYDDVTLAGVAKQAGVSHQTLLNHFESKEGLFRATIDAARPDIASHRARAAAGDAGSVVRVLVDDYERWGAANIRFEALEDRLDVVTQVVRGARAEHQGWLEEKFAEQLPEDRRERRRLLAALHAATDIRTWDLLRRRLGLSRADTVATMSDLVTAALAGPATKEHP